MCLDICLVYYGRELSSFGFGSSEHSSVQRHFSFDPFALLPACDATMLSVDFSNVSITLEPVLRQLNGAQVKTMRTCSDGACAIHSVWGQWLEGLEEWEFFKADARSFLAEAFGPTAEDFTRNLASPEVLYQLELEVWGLISPIAKQWNNLDASPLEADFEGQEIWRCLLESSPAVAIRCLEFEQSQEEAYRRYRQGKDKIIHAFGCLCTDAFQDIFIRPLLESLGLLEKYTEEVSSEMTQERCLSKFEAMFVGTAVAQQWQRTLVEEACLTHSFAVLSAKIADVVGGFASDVVVDLEPITKLVGFVEEAKSLNYESAGLPFKPFFRDVYPAYLKAIGTCKDYYISEIELLALARCTQQNVVIFTRCMEEGKLTYARSFIGDSARPVIMTALQKYVTAKSGRSHFERLRVIRPEPLPRQEEENSAKRAKTIAKAARRRQGTLCLSAAFASHRGCDGECRGHGETAGAESPDIVMHDSQVKAGFPGRTQLEDNDEGAASQVSAAVEGLGLFGYDFSSNSATPFYEGLDANKATASDSSESSGEDSESEEDDGIEE